MRRVDRERREHGEDALTEPLLQQLTIGLGELVPMHETDALLLERGQQVTDDEGTGTLLQRVDLLADRRELLRGAHAVGGHRRDAGVDLLLEARDPDLEELVEVLTEDRDELDALEQWTGRILGEREHPRIELQPGELAVDEPRARGRQGSGKDEVSTASSHRTGPRPAQSRNL